MSDDRQTPWYTYEVLSRFCSSRRPSSASPHRQQYRVLGDISKRESHTCTVQEVRSDLSPFANPRLRETNHILYPDCPFSSGDSQVSVRSQTSDTESSNPLSRLRQSIKEGWKSGENRRRKFGKNFRAFIVNGVTGKNEAEEWIASLNGIDVEIESSEVDEGWTVIDPVEDLEDQDDFFPLELSSTDLPLRIGFSLDIPTDEVRKGRKIGEGAFGLVFRAVYKNQLVVLKEVAPHHYQSSPGQRFIDSLKSELCVLGALGRHPNVLECYGGSVYGPNVFMLCQLMDMNLAELIYHQPDGPASLPVELALHITHDVLAGLKHLHSMTPKVVHRDIKPENILLNKRKHACVADFGLSRTKSHTYINTENTHAGTAEYLAPEVATGKVDEKMDVYSAGVILWECLMGERPWEGYHPFAVFLSVSEGQRLPFPEHVFPTQEEEGEDNTMYHVRKVIERCWIGTPKDRPSCAQIMDDIEDIFLEMYNYGR